MKWPESLTLIRHDESEFNRSKIIKEKDPAYQDFKNRYNLEDRKGKGFSTEITNMAEAIWAKYPSRYSDHKTPLASDAGWKSKEMAKKLKDFTPLPDVILVSPYLRTQRTLDFMKEGWPELDRVKQIDEERLREQEHGLAALYGDWRIFNVLNPLQKIYRDSVGGYQYRYPQGENVPDVRERWRSLLTTIVREYSGQNVMTVGHHLTILAGRMTIERFDEDEFERLDQQDKPLNAGVTIYRGRPELGTNGRLILEDYNLQLYSNEEVYLSRLS